MKTYKPKSVECGSDLEKTNKTINDNFGQLVDLDKEANKRGDLVGRFIKEAIDDGFAYYQIVKENKRIVHIEVCDQLGDDWVIPYWGEKASIDKDYAIAMLRFRDKIRGYFSRVSA